MNIKWQKVKDKKGILVAFDKTLQSLLLWWYKNLRKHCSLPIAFVSLGGLNENVKDFCKKNGYFYEVEEYVEYFKQIKIPLYCLMKWSKKITGDVGSIRPYWFTKPIAMIKSPFEKTLYLDMDCEVKGALDEIFSSLNKHEIAICKDILSKEINNKYSIYNSGVIVYKNKAKIIEKWAKLSLNSFNKDFLGDQDLLSHIIFEDNFSPKILSNYWNFSSAVKLNNLVKILHYFGGKAKINLVEDIKNDKSLFEETKKLLLG